MVNAILLDLRLTVAAWLATGPSPVLHLLVRKFMVSFMFRVSLSREKRGGKPT